MQIIFFFLFENVVDEIFVLRLIICQSLHHLVAAVDKMVPSALAQIAWNQPHQRGLPP